jgi:hypothetical protein
VGENKTFFPPSLSVARSVGRKRNLVSFVATPDDTPAVVCAQRENERTHERHGDQIREPNDDEGGRTARCQARASPPVPAVRQKHSNSFLPHHKNYRTTAWSQRRDCCRKSRQTFGSHMRAQDCCQPAQTAVNPPYSSSEIIPTRISPKVSSNHAPAPSPFPNTLPTSGCCWSR